MKRKIISIRELEAPKVRTRNVFTLRENKEIGDFLFLEVECPGLKEKDFAISIKENVLFVQGIILVDNEPVEEILEIEIPIEKIIEQSCKIDLKNNLLTIFFNLKKEYCEKFFKVLGNAIVEKEN